MTFEDAEKIAKIIDELGSPFCVPFCDLFNKAFLDFEMKPLGTRIQIKEKFEFVEGRPPSGSGVVMECVCAHCRKPIHHDGTEIFKGKVVAHRCYQRRVRSPDIMGSYAYSKQLSNRLKKELSDA